MPHFRTHAVILGADFLYGATGDAQWRDHIHAAARRMIEWNPGNEPGLLLLARDYLNTGDKDVLDWMRRLLVVGSPYMRAANQRFLAANRVPDDMSAVPWEQLEDLAKKAYLADIRGVVYGYRHAPYTLAAVAKAGLDEKQMELADFALDRQGMGQFHLRGPDAPDLTDARYQPVSLASAANADPLSDPFNVYADVKRHPLQAGELGFDFGDWGEFEPGFFPVRKLTIYPYRTPKPGAAEHDGTNFVGLPFGATWTVNNIPFALADPLTAPGGRTMLVVGKGRSIGIPVGLTARKLHVLGHVTQTRSPWKQVGARYRLNYADGSSRTIGLTNMEDYDYVFGWGFAKRALFARNWKVQGGWDGGAPALNNYPISCEEKPLKELVIEDAGDGIGFMILAVTAEVAGMAKEEAALDVACGPSGPGAAKNLWKEGATSGWMNVSGKLTQGAGVISDGAATFRAALKDGAYQVELQLTGDGGSTLYNVRANGRLVVNRYVQSSGCIPGVRSRGERVRFPVAVAGGILDLSLEADRTAGTWRHPARLTGPAWGLERIRVFPASEPPPAAPPEFAYGWVEKDLAMLPPISMAPHSGMKYAHDAAKDARILGGFRCRSPRGTFRADLPPGEYEAELLFGLGRNDAAEKPIRMNVSLQGRRVLTDADGGLCAKPVSRAFPFRVGADKCVLLTFESAAPECEWGISAVTIRPKAD
jgi:hypothetical protein